MAKESFEVRDICVTVPKNGLTGGIKYQYFVYEVELKKLAQPFFYTHYYLYLVASGEGELTVDGKSYPLKTGTLLLVPPWCMHTIKEHTALTYLYISFFGEEARALIEQAGIPTGVAVFYGREHLLDYWMRSIRRIHNKNSLFITEAVFMHTLSYLADGERGAEEGGVDLIESYIRENLTNPELSLRMVAGVFFYNEKYFSHLFKERFGVKFTEYLHTAKVNLALSLINEGARSVSDISLSCGFVNTYYFSKVFKRIVGKSPASYIRERTKEK